MQNLGGGGEEIRFIIGDVQVANSPSWMTLHGASKDSPSRIQIEFTFRLLPSITADLTQFSNMFVIL